jgi:uroporphyrinogen-III synthase
LPRVPPLFLKTCTVADTAPGVVVTRPAGPAADAFCARLEESGYRTQKLPLLVLEAIPTLPASQRGLIENLDQYQHIIFISGNAVRFGLECIESRWPQMPVGIHWYAIGDATARELLDHDIRAKTPGEDMTSEGLLSLPELQDVAGERVLIVKGEGGRETLRQALQKRGANVEELACYRRLAPQPPEGGLGEQVKRWNVDTILISSGEGLANFGQLLSPEETTKLGPMCLVVPSERVARIAREMGFERITIAENASDAAMLKALESCSPASEGEK